jgi:hypothetical protein
VKVRGSAPTEFEMQAQRLGLTEESYGSRLTCDVGASTIGIDATCRSGG